MTTLWPPSLDKLPLPLALSSLADIRGRLAAHNRGVDEHGRCPINGRAYAYHTYPLATGGGHDYFEDKAALVRYLLQVERVARYVEVA